MTDPPVVIAGGGIAGLSAALAIARAGRSVRLFEREPAWPEEGAGLQLSPNASRRLRAWGVLETLDATAPERVVVRRGRDALLLATLPLAGSATRWGAPFLVAHRADLHAALRAAVVRESRIDVRCGETVAGWEDGPPLRVSTGTHTETAHALVIADGVRSSLRQRLAGEPLRATGRLAWRALVPAAACPDFARAPASNLWLGARAHLVHYPLRGGTVVNLVAVVAGEAEREDDAAAFWSRPGDAGEIQTRFRGWSPEARALVAAASDWRVWPLLTRPAPARLAWDRVALAGDAAHPTMPFLAQGAAQAIEDAAALGDAFAETADSAVALVAYERTRLRRVGRIVAASERQAALYHLSGGAAAARDLAMRTLGARGLRAATDWIYRA